MKLRGVTFALLVLAACAQEEVLLPGERLDVRGNPGPQEIVNRALPLTLPPAVANSSWTHTGGNPEHHLDNVELGNDLSVQWSVAIGEGNSRRFRITADPVVADGRIFTMDSQARVSAISTGGAPLWAVSIAPMLESSMDASPGGLAVVAGRVYATTGFGRLSVLDAATGDLIWTQDFDAAATGAPMVSDGIVYVVTSNATGWALSAETGRVLWQVVGATSQASSAGGAAPVLAGPLVVFPFASGQMVSAVAGSGQQGWASSVAGQRLGRAFGGVTDLTGAPLFENGTIFTGSHAGRTAAFDAANGTSRWRADVGALGPLWLAGSDLFFVSDLNRLTRLDAATGETIWSVDLPFYTRARIQARDGIFLHHGPVMADGRLLLASDDGVLRQFDPSNGGLVGQTALPSGAARNPVIAGETLYIVTEAGTLLALR